MGKILGSICKYCDQAFWDGKAGDSAFCSWICSKRAKGPAKKLGVRGAKAPCDKCGTEIWANDSASNFAYEPNGKLCQDCYLKDLDAFEGEAI